MSETLFSIIVPFYNRRETIGECLEAIFDSEYKNFEVIAIDDNSSDNSADIIKTFPVKLVSLDENIGPGRCRNRGVDAAGGKMLVFIDSDVLMPQHALNLVAEDVEKMPQISAVQGIYSDKSYYKNFVSRYSSLHYHYYGAQIRKKYVSSAATYFLSVKRDVFYDIGGFDESVNTARLAAEDQLFGHKLNKGGYKIYLDKRILVEHRKRYSEAQYLIHDMQTGSDQVFRLLSGNMRDFIERIFNKEIGVIIPARFIYSVILAFFIFLGILLCLFIPLNWLKLILFAEIILFYLLNGRFLLFVFKSHGLWFFLLSVLQTYLKMLFAGFGCIKGIFVFAFQYRRR